jgi:hypothetical protein
MPLAVDRSKPRHYSDESGTRLWSVSQVISVMMGDRGFMDPTALQRGTDIHQIFALRLGALMGWCEVPDIPSEYAGYNAAITSWIEQAQPMPIMLERMLRHKTLPYAGTLDYVGTVGGFYGVLDLKTGQPQRWHSVQLHAYQNMLDRPARMWCLYVDGDGTFKQVAVKPNARDWAAFQNAISIVTWRES